MSNDVRPLGGRDPIIVSTSEPPAEAYGEILSVLRRFTASSVGAPDNREFAVLVREPETGTTLGGLWAQSRWGTLYIETIALPDDLRGRGHGASLIDAAEAEARQRGCHTIWLDTYEFQARRFYERHGFEVFGRIDGPPPIYPRYFMQKLLNLHPGRRRENPPT